MNKEILINVEPQEKRLAIIENKVLEEFSVERVGAKRQVGMYIKKGEFHCPAVKAAFVNLGLEKNGYLYLRISLAGFGI